MSDDHDVTKHFNTYMMVFGALFVGTILTVWASRWDTTVRTGIITALAIATVKATLVAANFMHLRWERSAAIWLSLALCAVFFVVLIFIPVLTVNDHPALTKVGIWTQVDHADDAGGRDTGH